MLARIPAALRLLARRKAYLAAMAGAALALTLLLTLLLAAAGLVAAILPPDWPMAQLGVIVAFVVYLPLLAVTLSFLSSAVRAYTVFAAGPVPPTPSGTLGALGGLALFLLGRRLRSRRGLLGWVADPMGAAAGAVIQRALPADHPLAALLQVAGLDPRRSPTRGVGLFALGLALTGAALWLIAASINPGFGAVTLAVLVVALPLIGVLGAAIKGALAGAWDRYLMGQVAAQAEAALGAVPPLGLGARP